MVVMVTPFQLRKKKLQNFARLLQDSFIMSSISDDEADSVAPESSISQQAETSSATTQYLPMPDPISIGEYFVVKDTPECLEEALSFLRKGDKVYHFLSKVKFYRILK
jgi:hypothetical protein